MTTIKGWMAGALVTGGVVFAMRGCLTTTSQAPEERIGVHMDAMCKIAHDNIKTPVRGLEKLGSYLDRRVDKLLADYGAMFAAIERIPDDGKHDDRARLARDRLRKHDCRADWARFSDAVNKDPAASALLERFATRLSRTIEIIGGQHLPLDATHLPAPLELATAGAWHD